MSEKLVSSILKSCANRFLFFTLILSIMMLSFSSLVFASFPGFDDLMALQGNVVDSNGNPLNNGNLRVTIWNNRTSDLTAFNQTNGTHLVYNSTSDFFGAIQNGRFDVMLGNGTQNLTLEFGRVYFMDIEVNGVDLDFNGEERQFFQSSVGDALRVVLTNTSLAINKTESSGNDPAVQILNQGNGTGLVVKQASNNTGNTNNISSALEVRNATQVIFSVNSMGNVTAENVQAGTLVTKNGVSVAAGGLVVAGGGVRVFTGAGLSNLASGANVSRGLNVTDGGLDVAAGGALVQAGGLLLRVGSGLSTLASGANVSRGLNVTDGGLDVAGGGLRVLVAGGLSNLASGANVSRGLNVTDGGLDVAAGGALVQAGGLLLRVGSGLSTLASGANVSRGLNVTDGGLTVTAGDLTITAGSLVTIAGIQVTSSGGNITQNANFTGLFVNKSQKGDGVAVLIHNAGNGTTLEVVSSVNFSLVNLTVNETFPVQVRNITDVVYRVNNLGNVTAAGEHVLNLEADAGIFVRTGGIDVGAGGALIRAGGLLLRVGSGLSTLASGANVSRGLNVTDGGLDVAGGGLRVLVAGGLSNLASGANVSRGLNITDGGLDVAAGGILVQADGLLLRAGSGLSNLASGANISRGLNVTDGAVLITNSTVTLANGTLSANISLSRVDGRFLDNGQGVNPAFGALPLFMNTSLGRCDTACGHHGLACSAQLNFSNGAITGMFPGNLSSVRPGSCDATGNDSTYYQICLCD